MADLTYFMLGFALDPIESAYIGIDLREPQHVALEDLDSHWW